MRESVTVKSMPMAVTFASASVPGFDTAAQPTLAGVEAQVAAPAKGVPAAVVEKEFIDKARPTSLIKRFATVEEVASMVAYVVSPLASATTGAALRVDGGVLKSAF